MIIERPQGNPATGTKITITHVPSGTTKSATVKDIFLTLGETYPMNVALNTQQNIETIVVTDRP